MKRLAAATIAALATPAVAYAQPVTAHHQRQYTRLYHQAASRLGHRAPGRNIIRDGLSTGRAVTDGNVTRSIGVLKRMLAPPPAPVAELPNTTTPSATTPTSAPISAGSSSGGGYASVPGVPTSFAACVALRESTNGAGSSNIYGILGPGGQGSIAEQKAAFAQMYAARGTQPWAPYDGC